MRGYVTMKVSRAGNRNGKNSERCEKVRIPKNLWRCLLSYIFPSLTATCSG